MNAPVDNRRTRLAAYAPWVARDYFMNQGPATFLVLLLVGFLAMQGGGGAEALARLPDELIGRVVKSMASSLGFLGTFFAVNGIVSNDRKFGYYKFLFSKPLSPLAYYALTFVTYGVGLLVVAAVLLGVWSVVVRPMFPLALFWAVGVIYIGYGGIGFLLSAAWRYDWVSLVTVLFTANVGWSIWGSSDAPMARALYLLPPVHRADQVYAAIFRAPGAALPWVSITWLAGYGLAAFALGLLVLRRRSLSSA